MRCITVVLAAAIAPRAAALRPRDNITAGARAFAAQRPPRWTDVVPANKVALLCGVACLRILVAASPADAQLIDGRLQLQLGVGFFSLTSTKTTLAGGDSDDTAVAFGLDNSGSALMGYGVSEHVVLGVNLVASHRSGDGSDSSDFTIGPHVHYLFSGDVIRPFVGAGLNAGYSSFDPGIGLRTNTAILGFGLSGGLHYFPSDSLSIGPSLGLGYSIGKQKTELAALDLNIIGFGIGVFLSGWV